MDQVIEVEEKVQKTEEIVELSLEDLSKVSGGGSAVGANTLV